MVMVKCRTCGSEYELLFGSPIDDPWCSDSCEDEFSRVVGHIAAGGDASALELEPDSRLWREAVKEVAAMRRREMVQRREAAEMNYRQSRPKRREPVARRYFSF